MNQISDGLWSVIRSADGMQTEIKETVQSVYDKLSIPVEKGNGDSSSQKDSSLVNKLEIGDATGAFAAGGTHSEEELNEPPGFGPTEKQNKKSQIKNTGRPNRRKRKTIEEKDGDSLQLEDLAEPDNLDHGAPPGFSSMLKHSGDASDEDPDVPPGFG